MEYLIPGDFFSGPELQKTISKGFPELGGSSLLPPSFHI